VHRLGPAHDLEEHDRADVGVELDVEVLGVDSPTVGGGLEVLRAS